MGMGLWFVGVGGMIVMSEKLSLFDLWGVSERCFLHGFKAYPVI